MNDDCEITKPELPNLPTTVWDGLVHEGGPYEAMWTSYQNGYTEENMLDYAYSAVAAYRDRCAEETKKLRAFAQAVMEAWPEGDIEGGYLQYIAEKHGLLAHETRYEPCGESCHCANYCDSEDWKKGVSCYRRTLLLTGELE